MSVRTLDLGEQGQPCSHHDLDRHVVRQISEEVGQLLELVLYQDIIRGSGGCFPLLRVWNRNSLLPVGQRLKNS